MNRSEILGTAGLAEWVSRIAYDELPDEVIQKAKEILFDCLGASLFTAGNLPWGSTITRYAIENGGGQPQATVIGTGHRSIATQAALANGTLAEGFELGDVHPNTATRPFPMILPAALAASELIGSGGRELIAGIVAGYEVNTRIGKAIRKSHRARPMLARGLYLPSLIGTFGGAAAAARIMRLDARKTTWSLGIAGALTGGYFQGHEEGAWTRRLNGGMAPSRAITAVQLAQAGFVGPEEPLEGKYGFYKVFAENEFDIEVLTENLGSNYCILESWLKAYPMNATLHAPVEALLNVMDRNGLTADDIESIKAYWYQYVTILAKKKVSAIASAQFSLPFALAVASVRGRATVKEFTDEAINDPSVKSMIDRVDVEYDPDLYARIGGESLPGRVVVRTKDGRSFSDEVNYPKGHPKNPMSSTELRQKFAVLTKDIISEATRDRIHDMVMDIDTVDSIAELMSELAVDTVKS